METATVKPSTPKAHGRIPIPAWQWPRDCDLVSRACQAVDLDGDGDFSGFERVGAINTTTQSLRTSTQIFILNELE